MGIPADLGVVADLKDGSPARPVFLHRLYSRRLHSRRGLDTAGLEIMIVVALLLGFPQLGQYPGDRGEKPAW